MRRTRSGAARARTAGTRVVVVVLFGVLAAGCGSSGGQEAAAGGPATVTKVTGRNEAKVTLTAEAVKRLGLQTGKVEDSGGVRRIPYGAVFYDPKGLTWTFIRPAARTFVRAAITVDRIEGDFSYLSDGPAVGAEVVTVGGPEIYGAELGVGDDE